MDESGKRMMGYLPAYWHDYLEMQQILQSQGLEIDRCIDESGMILSEAFIMSASENRIAEWERWLDLPPNGTLDDRRLAVLAYFQVISKLTRESIKTLVSVLYDGARTSPFLEDSTLRIIIFPLPEKANDTLDLTRLTKQLEKRKPCHITLDVQRGYCTWGDIKENFNGWDLAKAKFKSWEEMVMYIPK